MEPSNKVIRILAIDGGGIGGIVPARVLERLTALYPNLIANADIIAGTSTGGLIALGLANGMTPAALADLYLKRAGEIFSSATRRLPIISLIWAKYRASGLQAVVESIAGTATLHDLPKAVVIPMVALVRPRTGPKPEHVPSGIFLSTVYKLTSARTGEKYHSGSWPAVDAAVATSSGPSFFPAHTVDRPALGGRWVLWDGGVVANNPSLVAVGEVMRLNLAPLESIRILSLGTGYSEITICSRDQGAALVARPVISALLDTSVGSTAFLMRQLFQDRAVRVNVELSKDYAIDDASEVPRLNDEATRFCAPRPLLVHQPVPPDVDLLDWLKKNWDNAPPVAHGVNTPECGTI